MRLLITGGTGFIGSRLALRCLSEGHDVRILAQENTDAESSNRKRLEREGADVILGSVTSQDAVARATSGRDLVVHLAAAQHEMDVPDQHFRDVNVCGTQNVLEASLENGVERVVHGSTIGVYGTPEGTLDEETPAVPDNIYGVTKLRGEETALGYADRLHVVAIRIPEVYGPGDRRLLKLFKGIKNNLFFTIGKGENLHHLIYIEDLVDGLLTAARTPEASGEVILLGGPVAVTTNEMVQTMASALDTTSPRLRLPMAPFVALATVLEVTLRPLAIQPPLHRRRLDFFRKSFRLSTEKAERMLDFAPRIDFEEGARRTARWYEDQGEL